MEIKIDSVSLGQLDDAANYLVKAFGDRKHVAFYGEMGAGKTTLIQAICRALGVSDMVNSPTFSLINEYFTHDGESIFHFDLYRIDDISEMFDMGYEDYFYSDNWCFVEWPEKAGQLLPEDMLKIRIIVNENGTRTVQEEK